VPTLSESRCALSVGMLAITPQGVAALARCARHVGTERCTGWPLTETANGLADADLQYLVIMLG